MKEKTKKNIKENFELLVYVIICSAVVFQANTCNRKNKPGAQDKEPVQKTVTVSAKPDTVVSKSQITMLQNAATKTR